MAEVSHRVGVDRSTVWARLRAWEQSGFLCRFETAPNPRLFGAGLAGGSVRVDDPRAKPHVLEDLALVDGVLGALDHVGPWLAVMYAHEDREGLERSRSLVARLQGVDEALPCVPFRPPECTVMPSPLDWRVLEAVRHFPSRSLTDSAREIHVSPKTFRRRFTALIQGMAVWSLPVLDFTKYSGGVMARWVVTLRPEKAPDAVTGALRKLPGFVLLTNVADVMEGRRSSVATIDTMVHLRSVAEIDDVQREILSMPDTDRAEAFFPRKSHVYSSWFDRRIARKLKESAVTRSRR